MNSWKIIFHLVMMLSLTSCDTDKQESRSAAMPVFPTSSSSANTSLGVTPTSAVVALGMPTYGGEEAQNPPSSFSELAYRYQQLVTSFTYETGKPYWQYRESFFNEADFIRQCALTDVQLEKPITIYVIISKDGHVTRIESFPRNETAVCISKLLQSHIFSAPPFEFLSEIVVNFYPITGDIKVGPPFAGPRISPGELPCRVRKMLFGDNHKVVGNGGFSHYEVFECGEGAQQRFAIWRLGDRNRLEGELLLPAQLLKPHIKPSPENDSNHYLFSMVQCVLHDDIRNVEGKSLRYLRSITEVQDEDARKYWNSTRELLRESDIWALYALEDFDRPVIGRAFYAWRRDLKSLRLEPVPISDLAICDEEIESED